MREYTLQISPEKKLNPYTTLNWIDVEHVSCEPGEVVSTPPFDFWPRAAWWLKLKVSQYTQKLVPLISLVLYCIFWVSIETFKKSGRFPKVVIFDLQILVIFKTRNF